MNPPGDGEGDVAELLRARLDDAGLQTEIVRSAGGRPSLVARVVGPTDQPPLVLLSHTDVVAVEEAAWSHDPFGGEIVDGELWGRGAIDMKGVAVMHAEAAAALAASGATPSREVIVVAVADEEAGGGEGAGWLVRAHPGLVGLRDGAPLPEVIGEGAYGLDGLFARPVMPIVVGEKRVLRLRARAVGPPGHPSMPPERQAIVELARFLDSVAGHRAPRLHPVVREQFGILAGVATGRQATVLKLLAGRLGPSLAGVLAPRLRARAKVFGHLLGDSVTPTLVQGGYQSNVVPGEASVDLDCRLLPDTDVDGLLAELTAAATKHAAVVEELRRSTGHVSERSAIYSVLDAVSSSLPNGPVVTPALTPGTTDLRFFRELGAPAYGWVPLSLRPEVLATFHGHDERVPVIELERAVAATTEVVLRAAATPTAT